MSTEKSTSNVPDSVQVESGALDAIGKPVAPPPIATIKSASLRVDESFDLGGDPYNQTGQFFVKENPKK